MGKYWLASAIAMAGLLAVSPLAAQPSPERCALIGPATERLACYDSAQRTPQVPQAAAAPPDNAAVVIVAVRQRQGRNTLFTTEQGQTWVQVDFEQNYFPPPPFSAEIRPGRLGSFFLVPARGTAVRVRLRE